MGSLHTDNTDPPVPGIVEPAYGLYPGLNAFSEEYDAQDYRDWVEQSNGDPLPAPLILCIRDASESIGSGDIAPAEMARTIEHEVRLQGALFDLDRPVQQLICSGNIATAWTDEQLYALVSAVQAAFTLGQESTGWCVCLGTTDISEARLRLLRALGFLQIRFAVHQDTADLAATHRTLEKIERLADLARRIGVRQITIDLFYSASGDAVSAARLESFVNAVRPELVRLVDTLPARGLQSQRNPHAGCLAALDYENIGLDWFVRPGDSWSRSASPRRLHWSMLGFTDSPGPDVVGIGPGAVSTIGEFYSQNEHRWHAYRDLVDQDVVPTARGLELESDDSLRREIMTMILIDACINVRAVEDKWGIQFDQFFSQELEQLNRLQTAGSVETGTDFIRIPARGRRELSELCEVFDRRIRTATPENPSSIG